MPTTPLLTMLLTADFHVHVQVLGVTRQASLSSGSLSCGGSLPAAASTPGGDVTDGDDEDMQTYIVQVWSVLGNDFLFCGRQRRHMQRNGASVPVLSRTSRPAAQAHAKGSEHQPVL